ncbi:MAG: two-component system response regulator AtoC, partial [Myxococcota bacterium]
ALSARVDGPFRAVNCATLTPDLLASELFGHVKGAFTGAVRSRRGLLQLAHGGTLFLDEIAEIPLSLQARLLRVLESQTFVPVGGMEPIQVNVRILSATHKALRREVEAGRFRRDLMHRVRVIPLFLPPLVDRTHDIEALTWVFLRQLNDLSPDRKVDTVSEAAMDALHGWSWPGNVRELRNVLQAAHALGVGTTLTIDELTPELRGEPPARRKSPVVSDERRRLVEAMRAAGGKRAVAAERLGMHRTTLWRKLKQHGLA